MTNHRKQKIANGIVSRIAALREKIDAGTATPEERGRYTAMIALIRQAANANGGAA